MCHTTRLWCHATHPWCVLAHLCILLHFDTMTSFTRVVTCLPPVTSMCAATHRQPRYLNFGGFWKHFFADRVLFSMATSFRHWLLPFGCPPRYSTGSPFPCQRPRRQPPFHLQLCPLCARRPDRQPAIKDRRMATCTPLGAPTTNGHSR